MKKNNGFTLVELAIVIVIIGLITGGVLGAQSLIKSAERSELIKNISQYNTAVSAFQLEYDALPGDFNEAESYWGASNTDNGDGFKTIDTVAETIDLWNHLSLAEIVPGNADHTATALTVGVSNPYSSNAYVFNIGHFCSIHSCSNWTGGVIGRNLVLMVMASGLTSTSYFTTDDFNSGTFTSGLNNEAVKKIDEKMDDGNPIGGLLLAPVCGDITEGDKTLSDNLEAEVLSELSDTYRLTDETDNCFFFYKY